MFIGNFDFGTAYHPKGFLEYHLASVMALHDGEDCSTRTTILPLLTVCIAVGMLETYVQ